MIHLDRGLHYKRVNYSPGIGICICDSCASLVRAGQRMRFSRLPMGAPNPNCQYVNRERVFAEAWEKENERRSGLNFGYGILQDLMVTSREAGPRDLSIADRTWALRPRWLRVAFRIGKRDRVVAATVIQWLGSNCGFSWLQEVLRGCGFELTRIERKEEKAA